MSDVPEDVLLPLKDRMADWLDPDGAAFFLGKSLGVIPVDQSWGESKGLFWGPDPIGLTLMRMLTYLTDVGILEMRDDYGQFRWPTHSGEHTGGS